MITLKPIDRHNYVDVIKLSVNDDQKHFVASNMFSLAQAKAQPECVPLAIYHNETLVGFIMYAMDFDDQAYWIYRVMIDHHYQYQGYGKSAIQQVIKRIQEDTDHHVLYISFEPENIHAKVLYETLGFVDDGRVDGDEIIYRLDY